MAFPSDGEVNCAWTVLGLPCSGSLFLPLGLSFLLPVLRENEVCDYMTHRNQFLLFVI